MILPSERSTTDQKERPILFGAAMVRAILDGKKTQTRRVMKVPPPPFVQATPDSRPPRHPEPYIDAYCGEHKTPQNPRGMGREWCWWTRDDRPGMPFVKCPYGQPGDRLWVRETHAIVPRTAYAHSDGVVQTLRPDDNHDAAVYREGWERSAPGKWRPSIHMPRWASRITLELTDVRVQRLQDISDEDAIAEGVQGDECTRTASPFLADQAGPAMCFANLWNSLNEKRGYGWDANPFVWALTFRRIGNAV